MYSVFNKDISAMAFLFVNFLIAASTAFLFLLVNGLNEWMIVKFHFVPGIGWLSLSSGICVLATLLLGAVGAAGIFGAYSLLYLLQSKSPNASQAGLSVLAHAVAPYLVYLTANRLYGLHASLENLTSKRLLLVILACSAACPALQTLVMGNFGDTPSMLLQYVNMFAGNLVGALILAYFLKALIFVMP